MAAVAAVSKQNQLSTDKIVSRKRRLYLNTILYLLRTHKVYDLRKIYKI